MKKSQNRGRRDDGRNTVNKQRRAAAKSAEAAPGQGSSGAAAEPPLKWLEAWLGPEVLKEVKASAAADGSRVIDFVTDAVSHFCWQRERLRETCPGPTRGYMVHAALSALDYGRVIKASGGNDTEFTRACVLERVEALEKKAARGGSSDSADASPDTTAEAEARGWAEAQGFAPGGEFKTEKRRYWQRGSFGAVVPIPGLAAIQRWDTDALLEYFVNVLSDLRDLLGVTVLPNLKSAFDTAEFADLLWSSCAIALKPERMKDRDDLARRLSVDKERLLDFFAGVLQVRSADILTHAIPQATARDAARLTELLALAEQRTGYGEFNDRSSLGDAIADATPLQQQAWELRARGWLENDRWDYGRHDQLFEEVDYSRLAERSPSLEGKAP